MRVALCREQELLQKLTQLKDQLSTTAEQVLEHQAHADDLQTVIDEYDSQVLAPLAKRLTDAEAAQSKQQQHHQRMQEAQQQAIQDLKQEQMQLLQEHQQLLDVLAQKEEQVGPQPVLALSVLACQTCSAMAMPCEVSWGLCC